MKYIAISFLLITILFSCNQNSLGETQLINGYWQIKEAENPKGAIKQYDFIETVDFYEITDSIGVRKKAKPTIQGGFKVSEDQETFTTEVTSDTIFLHFKNIYDARTDAVFDLSKNQMKVKSSTTGLIFTYERFEKIDYGEEEI